MRGKERKEKAAERKKKPEKGYAGKEFEWGQGRERLENRDQGTEVKRGGRTGEGEARSFLPGLPRSPWEGEGRARGPRKRGRRASADSGSCSWPRPRGCLGSGFPLQEAREAAFMEGGQGGSRQTRVRDTNALNHGDLPWR